MTDIETKEIAGVLETTAWRAARLVKSIDTLTRRIHLKRAETALDDARRIGKRYQSTVSFADGQVHRIETDSLDECQRLRSANLRRYAGAQASACEILQSACGCGCT